MVWQVRRNWPVRSGPDWIIWERERNVLFNDALNTFYLRLYGVRHMVKDHSDSEKGNPQPPQMLHYRLTARVLLYASSNRQDSTYHGLCYTSRGALAGTRNSSMGPPMKDRSDDPSHHERTPLPRCDRTAGTDQAGLALTGSLDVLTCFQHGAVRRKCFI